MSNGEQVDFDKDGFGNGCDSDFNNNGIVDGTDISAIIHAWGLSIGQVGYSEVLDINSDEVIDDNDCGAFSVYPARRTPCEARTVTGARRIGHSSSVE